MLPRLRTSSQVPPLPVAMYKFMDVDPLHHG
jgi:hypothetical protein